MPVTTRRGQRGAVAIMFALIMLFMIGFMGLALDLGRLYNRQVELQSVADAAALGAAARLAGTAQGIDAALAAAAAAATSKKIAYEKQTISWSDGALSFSATPGGGWVDASAARAAPQNMVYARVDTAALGDINTIDTLLIGFLPRQDLRSATAGAIAVAGRSTINLTPLAICAMSATPAAARAPNAELVQYGFRRGVAYDLMNLNPAGSTPANFVINPIDAAGAGAVLANTSASIVGPFVCAGTMPMAGIANGRLAVSQPFPLADLANHLNSRFDQYHGGACNFRSAPPDANVKPLLYSAANNWMKVPAAAQSARSLVDGGKLMTVADPVPLPGGNTASAYGVLWAYAKPVPFGAYVPGQAEPEDGYPSFDKALWPLLYAPGLPEPKSSYPSVTPYMSGSVATHMPPNPGHGKGVRQRRVLHVALLDCPVASSASATVLAVGRFFMTVPASTTSLHAEFAGLASGASLGGPVELVK
jgi:Flp pilus assembly protein TadG